MSTDLDLDGFRATFLTGEELGPPLRRIQDEREQGPDPGDTAFARQHGLFAGFQVWMGDPSRPIWRVVDGRFAFPTEQRAAAYHAARLAVNSEGQPPVAHEASIGQDCHVFGGTNPHPLVPGMTLTAYFYIFRVQAVVVKLFVMQGPAASEELLTLEAMDDLARRVERRIQKNAS